MWVCSVDGTQCYKLTDFDQRGGTYTVPAYYVLIVASGGWPNGYTGPAVTPDGKTLVWSQITGI